MLSGRSYTQALHSAHRCSSRLAVVARVLQKPKAKPETPVSTHPPVSLSFQERIILAKHLNTLLNDSDSEAIEHLRARADTASEKLPQPASTSGRQPGGTGDDELVYIFSYGANMACVSAGRMAGGLYMLRLRACIGICANLTRPGLCVMPWGACTPCSPILVQRR